MPLRSTTAFPPGGFAYTQKETSFKVPSMSPFAMCVSSLSNHRKANNLPRSAQQECAEDIEAFTCLRLGNDSRFCVVDDLKKKSNGFFRALAASPQHVRSLARDVVLGARKVGTGIKILSDWLGDGLVPVAHTLAQSRADVCTGRASGDRCPFNKQGAVLSGFTGPAAEIILEQVEKKKTTVQEVQGESELFTCSKCLCHLPLKIHTPLETIVERTPKSMMRTFPPFCWIITEQNQKPA